MDDAALVRGRERGGDLRRDVDRLVDGETPRREARAERLAGHELHRDVVRVLGGADLVDDRYVRMAERGSGARFLDEPQDPRALQGDFLGEDLERDGAVEVDVAREEDLSHAARSESGLDLIAAEARSRLHLHTLDRDILDLAM